MIRTTTQILSELADREAIRDCLARYCRAVDRFDADLLRTAYWPGAMDHHTGFSGTVEEFILWAFPRLQAMDQNVHMILNSLILLDGDSAKVESYLCAISVVPGDEPRQVVVCGRYLDRFERRDLEWRIAERTVVHDWFWETTEVGDWSVGPFGMRGLLRGAAMDGDPSRTWLGL